MIALKDEWQVQRQQRQQEMVERRCNVRQALSQTRQHQQNQAAQLRTSLELFRAELAQADLDRRTTALVAKAELQQFRSQLQETIQDFLVTSRETRQADTAELLAQLNQYVATLQQETQDFLRVSSIERMLMNQQLMQELQTFRAELSQIVQTLRQNAQDDLQEIQVWVQTLQSQTQDFLSVAQQERAEMRAQMTENLAEFADHLRSDVDYFLGILQLMRQERAEEVQQTLSQARLERLAEVKTLFSRFAHFRTQLKQYHVELQQQVWGGQKTSVSASTAPVAPVRVTPKAVTRPLRVPPKSTPKVKATPVVPARKAPSVAPASTSVSPNSSAPPTVSAPPQPAVVTEPVDVEKAIYHQIHQAQGARLMELESALGINRFQAVDALRSLMQKGLVIQRDRTYHIKEDAGQ